MTARVYLPFVFVSPIIVLLPFIPASLFTRRILPRSLVSLLVARGEDLANCLFSL